MTFRGTVEGDNDAHFRIKPTRESLSEWSEETFKTAFLFM
jgi:hypothetical protein